MVKANLIPKDRIMLFIFIGRVSHIIIHIAAKTKSEITLLKNINIDCPNVFATTNTVSQNIKL